MRGNGLYNVSQWNKLVSNPFSDREIISWHHVNDTYIVALPREVHEIYSGKGVDGRDNHRENLLPILRQIYGDRIYFKGDDD